MKHEVYLSTAITAAKEAGFFIRKQFQQEQQISYKDTHNIVTQTDIGAEKIILNIVLNAFPTHSVFSEEKGMIENHSDYLWIIDPLDGTTNFAHGFEPFCVSIALAYKNEFSLGVVYHPMSRELFTAQKGKGAHLNGKQIQVSKCQDIKKSVVSHSRGDSKEEKFRSGVIMNAISNNMRTIRITGSGAFNLCYVAYGRFDALIGNGLASYDYAAGALIAQEAGASVTDFLGNPLAPALGRADLIVSNPPLHKNLLPFFKAV